MKIDRHISRLFPACGFLKVRLLQAWAGGAYVGDPDGFKGGQMPATSKPEDVERFAELVAKTNTGELAVLSYHPGISGNRALLQERSADRTIVALGGVAIDRKPRRNVTIIATGGALIEQAKLSLASEDADDRVKPGDTLHLFEDDVAGAIKWAVLNCHDYTHVELLAALLEEQIELLVVVTFNNATRLYWEYATADVHRLFCHIIIVNLAELGGSGVFVPLRRIGTGKQASIAAGGQIFLARGQAEIDATLDLDIAELRRLRRLYAEQGLAGPKNTGSEAYEPLAPSQHYMKTIEREVGPPEVDSPQTIPLEWNSKDPLVGIAQLRSLTKEDYIAAQYRLARVTGIERFEARVESRLVQLQEELRCRADGREKLDLLVFPEVFLPRGSVERVIVPFVEKSGTIVLCGVDYPGIRQSENRNDCMVIGPNGFRQDYTKITRSQYDAIRKETKSADRADIRMHLERGRTLYRFENMQGHSFGILICYDFSHLDLVQRLNLEGRDEPLDMLIVVAHNPSSALYRACCIADSHRFYQHVILCNVAQFGGSGIFAPVRSAGARQTVLDLGSGFETIGMAKLNLDAQREARAKTDKQLKKGSMMRRPGIFQRRLTFAPDAPVADPTRPA